MLVILVLVLLCVCSLSLRATPEAGSPPAGASAASSAAAAAAPLCIWRDLCPRVDGSSINLARCVPAASSAQNSLPPAAASTGSGSSSSLSSSQAHCAATDSWRSSIAQIARQQSAGSQLSSGRSRVAVLKSVHAQRLSLAAIPLGLCGLEATVEELFLNENQLRVFPDNWTPVYPSGLQGASSFSSSSPYSALPFQSQKNDLVSQEQRECLRRLDPVVLNLYDNQLVAIDMDFVLSLPRLEELDLSRNLLEVLPPVHATLEMLERSVLRRIVLKENRCALPFLRSFAIY